MWVQLTASLATLLTSLSSPHTVLPISASVWGRRVLVEEGEVVRLSCPAPRPWLLCAWTSPAGDRTCLLTLEGGQLELCGNGTGSG